MYSNVSATPSRESVERPYQDQIKSTLSCIREHPPEFGAIRAASAAVVDVFGCGLPGWRFGELAKLGELVLGLLPPVRRADAGINGGSDLSFH